MGSKREIEFIARGVCVHANRVLLCRAAGGYHYLPGGHVEFGESAADALRREIREETGLECRVGPPLLTMEQAFGSKKGRPEHHELNVVFHVEHLDAPDDAAGTPRVESIEPDIAFDWVDLAALPETDLRPVEMKAWLTSTEAQQGVLAWCSAGLGPLED